MSTKSLRLPQRMPRPSTAESRFPKEAIAAARAERLLGVAVPREFGGEGVSIGDVTDICYALGRACASTAMIYAMHQTKVACIVRHGRGSAWHQLLLRRLCGEQLLLASSTTEGQARRRLAQQRGARSTRETRASRSSGRRPSSPTAKQPTALSPLRGARQMRQAPIRCWSLFLKEDYTLERAQRLGRARHARHLQRGLQARGIRLREQILPVSYEKIHAHTMMPVAHLVWSGAWAGIAAAAVERARAFVRKATQRSGGTLPPGAAHLTRASAIAADAARPDRHRDSAL